TTWSSGSASCATRPRPSARCPSAAARPSGEVARYAFPVADEKIRLGGMALANGVLVHGPTSWAVAIRLGDGTLKTAAGEKPLQARRIKNKLLRGPARLGEVFAILPRIRRHLPEARLPFERASVAASMALGAALIQVVRRSRLHPLAQEVVGAGVSFAPAVLALRGGELAAYHGA